MMSEIIVHYKKIVESLKLLSISYKEQKLYFPESVDLPFELSDTYHNAFILLPKLIEEEFFTYKVIANLMRLENILNNVTNNPLFDSISEKSFLENEEWNKINPWCI